MQVLTIMLEKKDSAINAHLIFENVLGEITLERIEVFRVRIVTTAIIVIITLNAFSPFRGRD